MSRIERVSCYRGVSLHTVPLLPEMIRNQASGSLQTKETFKLRADIGKQKKKERKLEKKKKKETKLKEQCLKCSVNPITVAPIWKW